MEPLCGGTLARGMLVYFVIEIRWTINLIGDTLRWAGILKAAKLWPGKVPCTGVVPPEKDKIKTTDAFVDPVDKKPF